MAQTNAPVLGTQEIGFGGQNLLFWFSISEKFQVERTKFKRERCEIFRLRERHGHLDPLEPCATDDIWVTISAKISNTPTDEYGPA